MRVEVLFFNGILLNHEEDSGQRLIYRPKGKEQRDSSLLNFFVGGLLCTR